MLKFIYWIDVIEFVAHDLSEIVELLKHKIDVKQIEIERIPSARKTEVNRFPIPTSFLPICRGSIVLFRHFWRLTLFAFVAGKKGGYSRE